MVSFESSVPSSSNRLDCTKPKLSTIDYTADSTQKDPATSDAHSWPKSLQYGQTIRFLDLTMLASLHRHSLRHRRHSSLHRRFQAQSLQLPQPPTGGEKRKRAKVRLSNNMPGGHQQLIIALACPSSQSSQFSSPLTSSSTMGALSCCCRRCRLCLKAPKADCSKAQRPRPPRTPRPPPLALLQGPRATIAIPSFAGLQSEIWNEAQSSLTADHGP